MNKFLFWMTGFLPCRIINDGERPYLERFYLFSFLGWTFYIHRFVASDPDRGMHSHPWRLAFSIVLSGWYWEHTFYGFRKVRWFNSLTGDTFHRVVLPQEVHGACVGNRYYRTREDVPCWTLFFHTSKNVKEWGFLRSVGAVHNMLYKPNTESDGSMIYTPYKYTREGNQTEWWTRAPTGREVRKAGAM